MEIKYFIDCFRHGSKNRMFVELLKSGKKIETSHIKKEMGYSLLTVLARQINARDKGYKLESSHSCGKWYWQLKKDDKE